MSAHYASADMHYVFSADSLTPVSQKRLRPVLVIDPEDTEQVERLSEALSYHTLVGHSVDAIAAALRSLIAPEPDEPQGLGAVVRDGEGEAWVAHESDRGNRWLPAGSVVEKAVRRGWDYLPRPLTVLHTGWTGDES